MPALPLLAFVLSFQAPALSPNLKLLQPIVDLWWQGTMKSPDGKREFQTRRRWQVVQNGNAVRYENATPELDSTSEGIVYWDPARQEVVLLEVSNKGSLQLGRVTAEEGRIVMSGTITFPGRTLDFRNVFDVTRDGKLIDRWFRREGGQWLPGHALELRAAPK